MLRSGVNIINILLIFYMNSTKQQLNDTNKKIYVESNIVAFNKTLDLYNKPELNRTERIKEQIIHFKCPWSNLPIKTCISIHRVKYQFVNETDIIIFFIYSFIYCRGKL